MAHILFSGLKLAGQPEDNLALPVEEPGGWVEVPLPALAWPEKLVEMQPHLADAPAFCDVQVQADQGPVAVVVSEESASPFNGSAPPEHAAGLHRVAEGETSRKLMLRTGERLWLYSTGIALTVTVTASGRAARVIFAEGDVPPLDRGQGEPLAPGQTITRTVPRGQRLWLYGAT